MDRPERRPDALGDAVLSPDGRQRRAPAQHAPRPVPPGSRLLGIPPLFTGSWTYPGGARTTWITPLFHLTSEANGDIDSLHLGPYFQGKDYWAIPPLFSWHVRHADQSTTTWLTPAFHLSTDRTGDLDSLHVCPAWFWERDEYWFAPPLLS